MIAIGLFEKRTHLVEQRSSPYLVFEPVELDEHHIFELEKQDVLEFITNRNVLIGIERLPLATHQI
jgi:hypothetical protein